MLFRVLVLFTISTLMIMGCATPKVSDETLATIDKIDCAQDDCISFVYVHGAGLTAVDMKQGFEARATALHTRIEEQLYETPEARTGLMRAGRRQIDPTPVVYYWGDLARGQSEEAQERTASSIDSESGGLVAKVHTLGARLLHDVYWFEQPYNNRLVLLRLHDTIRQARQDDREIVLLGHSLGGVVAFNYAIYHVSYVNLGERMSDVGTPLANKLLHKYPKQTCIAAALESGLGEVDVNGNLVLETADASMRDAKVLESFQMDYWTEKLRSLDEYTDRYCLAADAFRGLVTMGSPVAAMMTTDTGGEGIMAYLFGRYLYEEGAFWIHFAHHNDPFGFPLSENVHMPRLLTEKLGKRIEPRGGFFMSATKPTGGPGVLNAHGWYFDRPADFAAALAQAYATGYNENVKQRR